MRAHSTEIVPLRTGMLALWERRRADVSPHQFILAVASDTNKNPGAECLERLVAAGYAEIWSPAKGVSQYGRRLVRLTPLGRKRCRDWGFDK